jgi:hypothetical protein
MRKEKWWRKGEKYSKFLPEEYKYSTARFYETGMNNWNL